MGDVPVFDFRSDTVTKPTPEMMRAIATAAVGDAARGDDPTVNELEATAAKMTGKEAALFVPSGTMGNLVALLSQVAPGEEVIVEASAHIYNSEVGSMAAVAGAVARPVDTVDGVLDPTQVKAAIKTGQKQNAARTALLCIENSHNSSGGVVTTLDRMAGLWEVALDARLPLHLDGARLFNAAAFLDCSVADICRYAHSVMFCLSKGLSAPIGSLLVGDGSFVARGRKKARMVGGGMRQAGLIAAAGLVALADPLPGLRHDHRMARLLAEGLAHVDPHLVHLETVQTNIVNCYLDGYPAVQAGFAAALRRQGVLVNQSGSKARFVTHRHIDEDAVAACISAVETVIGTASRAA